VVVEMMGLEPTTPCLQARSRKVATWVRCRTAQVTATVALSAGDAAAWRREQVALLAEVAGDPPGHLVGNLLDAVCAGVEGRLDPGSQGRCEALVLGDALLVPASPGRPGSEPLGEHVVRAIQVAEVNVANERPRRERFELLRLQ
jgi:hypothetical protein